MKADLEGLYGRWELEEIPPSQRQESKLLIVTNTSIYLTITTSNSYALIWFLFVTSTHVLQTLSQVSVSIHL